MTPSYTLPRARQVQSARWKMPENADRCVHPQDPARSQSTAGSPESKQVTPKEPEPSSPQHPGRHKSTGPEMTPWLSEGLRAQSEEASGPVSPRRQTPLCRKLPSRGGLWVSRRLSVFLAQLG